MGLLDRLFRRETQATAQVRPLAAGMSFTGLNDPALYEYIRSGGAGNAGGVRLSVDEALCNSAVFRCVDLLSASIGMLPLYMMQQTDGGKLSKATDHPLYNVLQYKPNGWQTPYEFKQLMQFWALVDGNAYAVIVRSLNRVSQLIPVHYSKVSVEQRADWSVWYTITREDGSKVILPASDILHIRGMSTDGVTGVSRVKKAAETISLAIHAGRAAERIFRNGMMVGGALTYPGKLSEDAFEHLKASLEDRYQGSENAGRWIITEEGAAITPFANTAADSQLVEMRAAQIEEIARVFGVPRPLMGVDDTSWGSGIEQLAILFVRFGLSPWFKAWEEAITRSCLTSAEWGTIKPDFDETELLRGTLKDQAEFFARALGAGGSRPWMEANEVREAVGLGTHKDGGGLTSAITPPKGDASNGNTPVA